MIVLKMILAIWTSVYLVLPSCPCQILSALGIENAHSQTNQVEEFDQFEIVKLPQLRVSIENDHPALVCHCDDNEHKFAEQCDYDEDIQSGCTISHYTIAKSWSCLYQPAFTTLGRSPPPALELTSHLPRQVLGVFIL